MIKLRRALILLFFWIVTVSCAKPKYAIESVPDSNNKPQTTAADCSIQFKISKLCLSWSWEKVPTSTEMGSLFFKVYRANVVDETPVLINLHGAVSLILWMPSMGHGSSPTKITAVDVGTYHAENVFFIMPGPWEMRFQNQTEVGIDEATVQIIR